MQELAKAHASVPPIAELSATLRRAAAADRRARRLQRHARATARRSGRTARRTLHHIVRQHPFARASLQDDDVTVDFAEHTSPRDRVAVVVTEPLTKDEHWQRVRAGRDPGLRRRRAVRLGRIERRRRGNAIQRACAEPHPGTATPMTTTPAPTPRFDTFYKHDELTRLLFDYAEAYPTLAAIRSIGKSYEGRDIWVATVTNAATGAAERQAGVLGRRQHPRRRADRVDRGALLPARARHQLRQRRRDHAAARHARGLPLPAPQPRRRRARARRPAAPHPLVDAALSVRRGAGRRPDRRGHRRRRPHPVHAHRRSARHLEEVRRRTRG